MALADVIEGCLYAISAYVVQKKKTCRLYIACRSGVA
jgi:hypothetical protein